MQTLWSQIRKIKWPLSLGLMLALLNAASDLFLPTVMQKIVDNGVAEGDLNYVLRMAKVMLIAAALAICIKYCKNICAIKTGNGYARNMRHDLFEKVLTLSPHQVDAYGAATLITRTTNDVTQISNILDAFVRMMVRFPITCIGGIILTFSLDREIAWIILAVVPVIFIISTYVFMSALPLFKKIQNALDRLNRLLRENLSGIRVIRAFNREADHRNRVDQVNGELEESNVEAETRLGELQPLMTLLVNLTIVGMVVYAIFRAKNGTAKTGVLIACIQYASQILSSVMQSSMLFSRIPRAAVSARRIDEVMKTEPEISDPETASPADLDPSAPVIEFSHVSYHFPGAEADVIHDLSFRLEKGKVTALIGATGSGKTTVIRLMERFFDCTDGSILLHGRDIRTLSQQETRGYLSPVLQKSYLFSGTLRYNLALANEAAGTDDSGMYSALDTAQARIFTDLFPEGLEHTIAQGGTDLSGGQKQRLSIARALMRPAEVFLFDDSFSALDFHTDTALRQALKPRLKEAAVLIIAQRISTITEADEILVMEDGRLIASGTHESLLADCPVYREIAASQGGEDA